MTDKIKLPDFDTVNKLCIEKLNQKFKEYGNDWDNITSKTWWIARIGNELKEAEFAEYEKEEIEELIDVICCASMRITKLLE